jgi:predicted nuclease of predicted toxin-antitoxin system
VLFVADENVSFLLVARLRGAGYEVDWIAESAPGIGDTDVLSRARAVDAVLVTFDRDFGELVFVRGEQAPRNIVYSRLGRAEPDVAADLILSTLAAGLTPGQMVTVTRDNVRFTDFPSGAFNG